MFLKKKMPESDDYESEPSLCHSLVTVQQDKENTTKVTCFMVSSLPRKRGESFPMRLTFGTKLSNQAMVPCRFKRLTRTRLTNQQGCLILN